MIDALGETDQREQLRRDVAGALHRAGFPAGSGIGEGYRVVATRATDAVRVVYDLPGQWAALRHARTGLILGALTRCADPLRRAGLETSGGGGRDDTDPWLTVRRAGEATGDE